MLMSLHKEWDALLLQTSDASLLLDVVESLSFTNQTSLHFKELVDGNQTPLLLHHRIPPQKHRGGLQQDDNQRLVPDVSITNGPDYDNEACRVIVDHQQCESGHWGKSRVSTFEQRMINDCSIVYALPDIDNIAEEWTIGRQAMYTIECKGMIV